MINFLTISNIFSSCIQNPEHAGYDDKIEQLVFLSVKTNKILWDLEDSARMSELGDKHVADAKKNIDKNNQIRNNLMREIDTALVDRFKIIIGTQDQFYSESPGMIIDRLAILFIKLSVIKNLLVIIEEKDLIEEYKGKEKIILNQIRTIGQFLDSYLHKLSSNEVYFEIQQPVKIYNDERIRKYIKQF